MESKKPFIGQASADVLLLVDRMLRCDVGDVVTYRELTQLSGRDVTVYRHLTDSARRILLREHNIVFRAVANEGYKRLDDAQVVDTVTTDRRQRIRNQARFAVRELSTVDYMKLEKDKQVKHNTGMAMFGIALQSSDGKAMKRLQARVANCEGKIDVTGTLKLVGWLTDEEAAK